jgi:hypothetical protein
LLWCRGIFAEPIGRCFLIIGVRGRRPWNGRLPSRFGGWLCRCLEHLLTLGALHRFACDIVRQTERLFTLRTSNTKHDDLFRLISTW